MADPFFFFFSRSVPACARAFTRLIRPRPPTRGGRASRFPTLSLVDDQPISNGISVLLIVFSSGENNSPIAVVLARNVHFPMKPCVNATQEARLDVISARGFWGDRFSRSLFDAGVFHPTAQSAIQAPLASQYAKHERSKRREYEQWVCDVEGASFAPLAFSSTGGMGHACATTFKHKLPLSRCHIQGRCRPAE